MNKEINAGLKITGIGCGQCGTQIIAEIEKAVNLLDGDKSNLSFIGINTSTEDLSSVTLSHKIHINNSKGAACDRNKSTEALADGIDEILEELQYRRFHYFHCILMWWRHRISDSTYS